MDIDPVELEIVNLAPIGTNQNRVGRIILSDRDPNGAGFAVSLSDNLQNILSVVNGVKPDDGDWTWLRMLVSEEHQKSCQSSVQIVLVLYKSKRTWVDGLATWFNLLRVLANENENHFANVENGDILSQLPENDYRSILNYMEILAERLVNAGGSNMEGRIFGQLPERSITTKIRHTFWFIPFG